MMQSKRSDALADHTVHHLLIEQLGRLYEGECCLAREIPGLVKVAFSIKLKNLLTDWIVEIGSARVELLAIARLLNVGALQGTSSRIATIIAHERKQIERLKESRKCEYAIIDCAVQQLEHLLSGYEVAEAYADELQYLEVGRSLRALHSTKVMRQNDFQSLKDELLRHVELSPLIGGAPLSFYRNS